MASKSLEFRPLKHPQIAGPWTSFPARSWRSVARVRCKSWVRANPRSMHLPCMPAYVTFPMSRFVQFTTLYNLIQLPNWTNISSNATKSTSIPFNEYDSIRFWMFWPSPQLNDWMEHCSFYKGYVESLKPKDGFNCEHQLSSKQLKVRRLKELRVWLGISNEFNLHLSGGWCFFALRTAKSRLRLLNWAFSPMCIRSVDVPFVKLFQKFLEHFIFKKASYHSSSILFIFFDIFPFPSFSHQFHLQKKPFPRFLASSCRRHVVQRFNAQRRKGPRWRPRRRSTAPKAMAFTLEVAPFLRLHHLEVVKLR